MISLVTQMYSKLERLKYLSHAPPFKYEGYIGLLSLSLRLRKFFFYSQILESTSATFG